MSPEEFKLEMQRIFAEYDTETAHARADTLMCELLRELGFGKGIVVFQRAEKWYA